MYVFIKFYTWARLRVCCASIGVGFEHTYINMLIVARYLFVHLVELIDETDALVREHQRAAFERPLLCHRVTVHTCGSE